MKNTKSNLVKESILDYEALANSMKENTAAIVKDLLGEAVRATYNQILTEEDENDYDVEEVDDTELDDTEEAEEPEVETVEDTAEAEGTESEGELEGDIETTEVEDTEVEEVPAEEEPEGEDAWADFDQYKLSDGEYDFSQADDEDVVKVYKLLKDDDQVFVNVDKGSNKVEIKDNNTGAEYLLDLGGNEEGIGEDFEEDAMNESRIYELVLNEYDSHVGYTNNYQKQDVMSNPGMSEPGKNVNDWDEGVPKGTSKPWASKGDSAPFNGEKGKTIEECGDAAPMQEEEEPMEEATNVGGFVQQNSTSKSHIPNSNGRKARNSSVASVKTKGTATPRYAEATNESKMMNKVNAILKENKALKAALVKFKSTLEEAAVTNVNLGQIIKLISENSTTKDEKKAIIERFGAEAKTIEESKRLYNTISRDLQSRNVMNINEEKQFTANGSQQINETQIYKSKDLLASLDLMHRLCK